MTLKDTNTNALLELSFKCGSGAGMKHIGFYLDGLDLTVNGKRDGTNSIPVVHLKLMLNNSGSLEIADNMEIGND